jgi:hypothetical protein
MQATLWKEELHQEIEEQMELGIGGLLEEDHWMLEVNLGDRSTLWGNEKNTG